MSSNNKNKQNNNKIASMNPKTENKPKLIINIKESVKQNPNAFEVKLPTNKINNNSNNNNQMPIQITKGKTNLKNQFNPATFEPKNSKNFGKNSTGNKKQNKGKKSDEIKIEQIMNEEVEVQQKLRSRGPPRINKDLNNNNNNFNINYNNKNNFNRNNIINNNNPIRNINNNNINNNAIKILNNNNQNNNMIRNENFYSDKNKDFKNIGNKTENVILYFDKNTSYMICSLYCFANNDKIRQYLEKNVGKNEKDNFENQKIWTTFLFWRILFHLNKKDTAEYKIDKLYDAIIIENPIFKGTNNKNVADFIIFFLNKLHLENKIRNNIKEYELTKDIYSNSEIFKNKIKKYEDSYIFNNYALINEKIVKCLGCKNETKINSFFFTYDLDISSAINKYIISSKMDESKDPSYLTIKNCLDYLKEEEILYNVYCHSCDKKTNFERKSTIYSTSDSIIFLLNGIEQENTIKTILDKNIKIKLDQNLELNNIKYVINSVIYYNIANKNYMNYCYNNGKWVKYWDNKISIEKNDFLNKLDMKFVPVVLFYSKK